MRSFDKDTAQDQFDKLIESVQDEGPFSVQLHGKDVAVFLPPALYEALLTSSPSSPLTTRTGDEPPKR
jgi:hypothetical protein